jgi:Acetyltransferase (GNAT) family.
MKEIYTISIESPFSADAAALIDELSDSLQAITGSSGRSSFDPNDVCVPRSAFVIIRRAEGMAEGCGALRPIDENTAEIKRMYCRTKGAGLGSRILAYLEAYAANAGYTLLRLETRRINKNAVAFYLRRGYYIYPITVYTRAGKKRCVLKRGCGGINVDK